jgi:pimeloyl-ACP methyl ester carboxylesterase
VEEIPSWYLVSQKDNTINPELQRFYAERMGATTNEISASHVAYISRPKEVVNLIDRVAQTVS